MQNHHLQHKLQSVYAWKFLWKTPPNCGTISICFACRAKMSIRTKCDLCELGCAKRFSPGDKNSGTEIIDLKLRNEDEELCDSIFTHDPSLVIKEGVIILSMGKYLRKDESKYHKNFYESINIPIVGKQQVYDGREMSWIRVDRYFKGNPDNPEFVNQPVACVHCENAPCEQVCPVAATVHDEEGLNVMVYNRCIGTRYCSNNCPYKVRRFNFHNYTKETPEVVQMAHNPDVTVRFRGVMEKCTFCIQRLKEVDHKSKVDKKPVDSYNVKTACQSACPADCIEFGNIKDTESRVYTSKQNDRDYSLLEQLNFGRNISFKFSNFL